MTQPEIDREERRNARWRSPGFHDTRPTLADVTDAEDHPEHDEDNQ